MFIKLAIVNDYPIVVAGLHTLLAPHAHRFQLVRTAVDEPVDVAVDVVLYDTFGTPYGPGENPRAALGVGKAKLIAFTFDLDPRGIQAALDRGFDGFISKTATSDELVEALERAHAGHQLATPDMTPEPEPPLSGRWPGAEHGLSARESQVLALVCQGLSNLEISQTAYLSINTVKTYIRTAYRKIDATNRSQAVIWGLSHGLDKPPDQHTTL